MIIWPCRLCSFYDPVHQDIYWWMAIRISRWYSGWSNTYAGFCFGRQLTLWHVIQTRSPDRPLAATLSRKQWYILVEWLHFDTSAQPYRRMNLLDRPGVSTRLFEDMSGFLYLRYSNLRQVPIIRKPFQLLTMKPNWLIVSWKLQI